MKYSYDIGDVRRMNAINILELLRVHGPLSRANLAGILGLTRATSSNIVADLLNTKLIREKQFTEGGVGRPGLLFEINPNAGCLISLKIDIDFLSLSLAQTNQNVIFKTQLPVSIKESSKQILNKAENLIKEAINFAKGQELAPLGICAIWSGIVNDKKGELVYGPTTGWSDILLRDLWQKKYGIPVFIENEAHAAAIGMYQVVGKASVENLIYLSIGAGIGAGIYVNGTLMKGHHGYAGQVGHITSSSNEVATTGVAKGGWASQIGLYSLVEKIKAAGIEIPEQENEINLLDELLNIIENSGNELDSILSNLATAIAEGIVSLVHVFNPNQVVLGGRMGKVLEKIGPQIDQLVRSKALPHTCDGMEILFRNSDDDHMHGGFVTIFNSIINNPIAFNDDGTSPANSRGRKIA